MRSVKEVIEYLKTAEPSIRNSDIEGFVAYSDTANIIAYGNTEQEAVSKYYSLRQLMLDTFSDPKYTDKLQRILDTQFELREKGRRTRCIECNNPLTDEDEDHSFCNKCWNELMAHPFEGNEYLCSECNEPKENEMHKLI